MDELSAIAPAFIEMAHRIVWCSVASVGPGGRPRSRILHPIWQWDGERLTGWIATGRTGPKVADLERSPYLALSYWAPSHDTCTADCRAEWVTDDAGRKMVWDLFVSGPEPVGYDPKIVPGWDSPTAPAFAALRLEPERLRVFPGSVLLGQGGAVLRWKAQ